MEIGYIPGKVAVEYYWNKIDKNQTDYKEQSKLNYIGESKPKSEHTC